MKSLIRVASAPGKIILFGEHFVVYGTTAVVAAINRRTTARAQLVDKNKVIIRSDIGSAAEFGDFGAKVLEGGRDTKAILAPLYGAIRSVLIAHSQNSGVQVELKSQFPYGIGLGSSAASCVASAAAVDSLFRPHDKNWICERALESERMIHKNSSGADCYICTFGGIMRYGRDDGYTRIVTKSRLRLVVSNTGIRHSTGELVERVRKFRQDNLASFKDLSTQANEICIKALQSIKSGKIDKLGRLMLDNQELLRKIGVSHRKAEALIDLSMRAGAIGAKITGAGGGGAVIALASSSAECARIARAIRRAGYGSMEVELDSRGLVR